MRRCFVSNCRHAHTHVTAGHRCGSCGGYGHGQVECDSVAAVQSLRDTFRTDTIPTSDRCTFPNCSFRHLHTRDGHFCRSCKAFACTCEGAAKKCPVCRIVNAAVDVACTVFTNTDCVVCMDAKPCVVFPTCRHACVCAECARAL